MKTSLLVILLAAFYVSNAQSAHDSIPSRDSLLRYCERLEHNQFQIYHSVKNGGKDMERGIYMLLAGIAGSATGVVVTAISPAQVSIGGHATRTNPVHIVGIAIAGVSCAISIAGLVNVAAGARRLRDM